MREHIAADEPFMREDVAGRAGARALPRRGPGLQGRAHRGPGPRRGRRDRLALHQRPLHRPVPRAARAEHQAHRRVQAAVGRRRLLARRRQPPDAHAHLRDRLLQAGRARRVPRAARAGARPRPPQARPRARPVHLLAGLTGLDLLAAARAPRSSTSSSRSTARMQQERGYVEVKTPLLYESQLWETSGHWGKYKENIFVAEYEDREFGLKPMNCPGHCHLFGLQQWSYRDLPVRYAEPGLLHRREPSGTLHGLLRVRHFIQDDAHIFCTEDQIQDEVSALPGLRLRDLPASSTSPSHVELSTRPDNRLGDDALWDHAEARAGARRSSSSGLEYTIDEGEGAFYGPKIDLHMTDSLGRSWQLGTVQLDYNMPERFGLTYTGADNAEHTPGDDPPRALRLLRALHRDPARAHRRRAAAVAGARAGRSRCRSPTATTTRPTPPSTRCARPGCAPRSTTAPSRSGARSATPSCRRSPTCSWSATARPRRGRSPCAATARATRARWRSASSSSGSPPRSPPA